MVVTVPAVFLLWIASLPVKDFYGFDDDWNDYDDDDFPAVFLLCIASLPGHDYHNHGFDEDWNDYDGDITTVFFASLLWVISFPDHDYHFPGQDICLGITISLKDLPSVKYFATQGLVGFTL